MSTFTIDRIQPPRLEAADVLRMVAKSKFEPFQKADWQAFLDCQTPNPMIAYCDEGEHVFTLVLDGPVLNILQDDDAFGGYLYTLHHTP